MYVLSCSEDIMGVLLKVAGPPKKDPRSGVALQVLPCQHQIAVQTNTFVVNISGGCSLRYDFLPSSILHPSLSRPNVWLPAPRHQETRLHQVCNGLTEASAPLFEEVSFIRNRFLEARRKLLGIHSFFPTRFHKPTPFAHPLCVPQLRFF